MNAMQMKEKMKKFSDGLLGKEVLFFCNGVEHKGTVSSVNPQAQTVDILCVDGLHKDIPQNDITC